MIRTFLRSASSRFESRAHNLFVSIFVLPDSMTGTARGEKDRDAGPENDRFERDESFYWCSGIFGQW